MTQIEKVARASFACWRKRMDELGHHLDMGHAFEDMTASEREFAFLNARAMIEAMRDPSDGMLDAGVAAREKIMPTLPKGAVVAEHPAGTIFVAMIDAALKEE